MQVEELSGTLMLTIDQVSQLTGVRKSTLRYWEKVFESFLRPARTHSNRREYSLEDVERIRFIKHLLEEEHLTTAGVRMRLAHLAGGNHTSPGHPPRQGKDPGAGPQAPAENLAATPK